MERIMSGYSLRLQEPPFALPFDTILHGRYRIGKVLGFGGFGITYMGEDLRDQRRVAVKEYFPGGFVSRHPGKLMVETTSGYRQFMRGKDNFLQEARIIYHCKNSHILKIFSLFEENGTAYYVMEYLQGSDLRELLKRNGGRLSWADFEPVVLQIMDALCEVHKEGIIHRDISPDNIYITEDRTAKLIDFGAARALSTEKSRSVILKKGYAPPEQYQSHGRQGPWTDIYALGGTMFRALTGEMPPESVERVRHDTLKRPETYGIGLPPSVSTAIMKALSLREEQRFQRVEAFRQALMKESIEDSAPTGRLKRAFGEALKRADGLFKKNQAVTLVGITGFYASQSFKLEQDVTVGRDPSVCGIIFPPDTP
ncbi:MAG TPA: hypothetical protein DCL38_02405, partial [Lachnospiraceae bacterium]|nr:hypothetical protein [Lachnospiraceae bacterium]